MTPGAPSAASRLLGLLCAVALCAAAPVAAQWSRASVLKPVIVGEGPHDTAAFTQGLLWLNGSLYESTGLYGASSLRELNPVTGAVRRKHALGAAYFGEGLAFLDGDFVQITWKEGVALRYRQAQWGRKEPRREPFAYAGEGWGLTTLGKHFWMSNGSDTLYRRDKHFKITGRVGVRLDGRPLRNLNELEGVGDKLIANVWYSDSLFIIDPGSGVVMAVVDGSELARRSGRRSRDDVLNGIAYDPVRKLFYVTGKNWPRMFRVNIPFAF